MEFYYLRALRPLHVGLPFVHARGLAGDPSTRAIADRRPAYVSHKNVLSPGSVVPFRQAPFGFVLVSASPGVRRGTLAIEERQHAYVSLLFQRRVVSASPGGWRGTVAIEERLHAYVPLLFQRRVVSASPGGWRETNGRPPTGDLANTSKTNGRPP